MSYCIFKVSAATYEDMQAKTNEIYAFTPSVNATQAYNNYVNREGESANLTSFCESYLSSKKLGSGEGAYVVLDSPVKDTKSNPTKVVKFKREGRSIKNKAFEIYDPDTLQIYDTIKTTEDDGVKMFPTRAVAFKRAQEVVKQIKKSVSIREVSVADSPNIGQVEYNPSTGAKGGEFIVFGSPSTNLTK